MDEAEIPSPTAEACGAGSEPEPSVPDPPLVPPGDTQQTPVRPPGTVRASGRLRLVPPDHQPVPWWVRHRGKIQLAEWVATFFFMAAAGFFVWLMVFPTEPVVPEPEPRPPSREEFRELVRLLDPAPADPAWAVEAKPGRWRSIVLHHSGSASGSADSFDRYHREGRGWENGLGYHFVIGNGRGMGDGEIAVGNRWLKQLDGAHARGRDNINSYGIGICLVGNFSEELPTPKQLAALKGLVSFLRREYGIGLRSIHGHNVVAEKGTECPGAYFFIDEVLLAVMNL